jgi:hypothetical protein
MKVVNKIGKILLMLIGAVLIGFSLGIIIKGQYWSW